ncbi:galectin-3 [Discoglossus pictus]
MADDGFSLNDALSGQNAQQSQNPAWPGYQNPGAGQQYPGAPPPGQAFPGYPGQPYPGFPGQPGQAFPGAPVPPGGTATSTPAAGQQYPGFPAAGQQYPGFPAAGQQYPGFPPAGQQYPGFPGPGQQYPGYPGAPGDGKASAPTIPASNIPLKIPYELPLPSGVVPGLLLTVQGNVNGNAKRFVIDFKKGQEIAFHVNPRLDEKPNTIVRNSMLRGQWGKEERHASKFPFQQGKPFKIQILCQPDKYNVAVNNESLFQYQHRVRELNEIKQIVISGDITLSDVSVTTA